MVWKLYDNITGDNITGDGCDAKSPGTLPPSELTTVHIQVFTWFLQVKRAIWIYNKAHKNL
jgi:hypothetical protein